MDRHRRQGVGRNSLKSGKILVPLENGVSANAAIKDVEDKAGWVYAGAMRQGAKARIVLNGARPIK